MRRGFSKKGLSPNKKSFMNKDFSPNRKNFSPKIKLQKRKVSTNSLFRKPKLSKIQSEKLTFTASSALNDFYWQQLDQINEKIAVKPFSTRGSL